MLEKIIIGILLCTNCLQAVGIEVLWVKLKRARQHAESWKLAAEHWEKQANGW